MAKVIDFNPNSSAPMTEYVATRWYRAPEIMMWKAYGFEVDVWSIGCVMAELLMRKPLFPGQDLQDQIRKIIAMLGPPPPDFIQQIQNPRITKWLEAQTFTSPPPLKQVIPGASSHAIDLLSKMLRYSPYKRISVALALQHPYFADFHDPKSEHVMESRVKFPHYVEKFNLEQLKNAVMTEVAYYARKNNYIAEMVGVKPAASDLMPSIGTMESKQQEQEIMNMVKCVNNGGQLGIVNDIPVMITPVCISSMQMMMTAPMMQSATPWVIDKENSPKKPKGSFKVKMEVEDDD